MAPGSCHSLFKNSPDNLIIPFMSIATSPSSGVLVKLFDFASILPLLRAKGKTKGCGNRQAEERATRIENPTYFPAKGRESRAAIFGHIWPYPFSFPFPFPFIFHLFFFSLF
jgi:hypothetical protein